MEYGGPGIWIIMHKLSFDDSISNKKKTIMDIIKNLPCEQCRDHAFEYIDKYPIPDDHVEKWLWIFHNKVNKRLNKPLMKWRNCHLTYS